MLRAPHRVIAWIALALVWFAIPVLAADTFDEFLRRYGAAAAGDQPAVLDAFLESQRRNGRFPISEPNGEVVFLYRVQAGEQEVRLLGDFAPINSANVYWHLRGLPMERLGALFYARRKFEADARLDYMFLVDGVKRVDPLNPDTLMSGTGEGMASQLTMPAHRADPRLLPRASATRGTLVQIEQPWADPAVRIYLPAGYNTAGRYKVMYTADGNAWIDVMKLTVALDNMIADGSIEPIIAVMVDSQQDRRTWYYFSDDYLAYLSRVVEYVDRTYATSSRREDRLHIGSSAGGRAALVAALEKPEWFGNVALFSGAIEGPISYFAPLLEGKKGTAPLRIWLSAGTYETGFHADAKVTAELFRRRGQQVREVYVHQGHSFGAWRELSIDMLVFFFGK